MKKTNAHNEQIYRRNLEKYSLYNPIIATSLDIEEFPNYEFCYSHLGELNLRKTDTWGSIYFHDMEGIWSEVKQWYQTIPFNQYNQIFLYGLGLGYYYEITKSWLRSNKNNYLFFIEDDKGVLKKFLETSLAEEILADPQVIVHFLDYKHNKNLNFQFVKSLLHLIKGFVRRDVYLSSSKCYSKFKEPQSLLLRDVILNTSSWNMVRANEMVLARGKIFGNFYATTLRQFNSYNANVLKNKFFNIPAIICGAGPSIVNEIEKLKTVLDKAIIIGSGTGMNVLNYFGIIPHFGTGLDPTDSQGTRIRTNYAFEVPFFYRTRFHKESFELLHGPKLLLAGHSGYAISRWFTKELKIDSEIVKDFKTGISSSNFSLEFAKHLGCNPIILLGCDMAYTDASRYPPIISAHPTDIKFLKKEIDSKSETLLLGKGYDGKNVLTKMDWIAEAQAFTDSLSSTQKFQLINSTNGGLFINKVDYMPFKNVIDLYLQHSWDIKNMIHARIEESQIVNTKEECIATYETWKQSLLKSKKICEDLEEELKQLWQKCNEGFILPDSPYNEKMAALEEELLNEPAFKYYLVDFIEIVDDTSMRAKLFFRCHSSELSECEKSIKRLEIDFNYIAFYKEHLIFQLDLIDKIYNEFIEDQESLSIPFLQEYADIQKKEIYTIENNRLIIFDEELNLDINIPFEPKLLEKIYETMESDQEVLTDLYFSFQGKFEGQYLQYHDNGTIFCEMFFHNDKLHGPITYFSPSGSVLSKSWFIDGLQQGKSFQYYLSGALHGIQRYKNNLPEGIQECYYENNVLKSKIAYSNGILNGKVELYYSNGRKKREMTFKEGKLHGCEKCWYPNGILQWEVLYTEGMPKDKARIWNRKGKIIREYTYFDDHKHYNLKEWNSNGELIYEENNVTEDLKESAVKKAEKINEAICNLNQDLNTFKTMTKNEKKQMIF